MPQPVCILDCGSWSAGTGAAAVSSTLYRARWGAAGTDVYADQDADTDPHAHAHTDTHANAAAGVAQRLLSVRGLL